MKLLLSIIFLFSISGQALAQALEQQTDESFAAATAVESPVDNRKESEIPLNLDNNKKANTEGSGVFRIIFTLGILGLVGAGAVVFLRKYKIPQASKHQTQIKILQQHFLGPKKSLAIVRVAGESILVGITDHNITMIKSLSLMDDEVPAEAPQNFNKVLSGLGSDDDFQEERSDDEFSISGIKDIVSKRLKGMRPLQ